MTAILLDPAFDDWRALATLLRDAYAPMRGRIDPPTSLDRMTEADLAQKARTEDLFLGLDGSRPVVCGFGAVTDDVYEIGKIAVAVTHRRQGLSRALIDAARARAAALGAPALQLSVRRELTENHAVYRALGFSRFADFTHPGFDRPTSTILRRPV